MSDSINSAVAGLTAGKRSGRGYDFGFLWRKNGINSDEMNRIISGQTDKQKYELDLKEQKSDQGIK